MARISILASVIVVLTVLSLSVAFVFQQQEVSRLQGKNEELNATNVQNEHELENLNYAYSMLNASYLQTLGALQEVTALLNASETKASDLSQSLSSLTASYNALETTFSNFNASYFQTLDALRQTTSLLNSAEADLSKLQETFLALNDSYNNVRMAIMKYSEQYNGTSGVFVLACQTTHSPPDYRGYCSFVLTASLYNLLEPCNATLEFYNTNLDVIGHIHDFNLNLTTGKNDFVIGWDEQVTAHENYRLLVTRG